MSGRRVPDVRLVRTDWIIGWKAATPYVRESGELVFMPLVRRNRQYVVDDRAVCDDKGHSRPPEDNCRCGFNAWADASQAISYAQEVGGRMSITYKGPHKFPLHAVNDTRAILRVGLYGDVISATKPAWGYRGERQRVADMFVCSMCALCQGDGSSLGVMNAEYPLLMNQRLTAIRSYPVWPLCDDHVDLAKHTADPMDIARQNNVKIHRGYPASQ